MSEILSHPLHFYIIVGEASGDQIGASLMEALKKREITSLISGIGGREMEGCGLHSLFPMSDLSVMGIFEIFPHIFKILKRLKETYKDIVLKKPDVIITIDSPGFNFRLAKKLKKIGIPVIHYGAPSVWAWRPKRAKKISKFLTHLFTLFPFEPLYFQKEGLETTFIGHPLSEINISAEVVQEFRQNYSYQQEDLIFCLLPGSRVAEVKRLLPIFLQVAQNLQIYFPNLKIVLPVVSHLKPLIISLNQSYPSLSIQLIEDKKLKFIAMAASKIALAASGTVALELALAPTPMVIAYKINFLTALFLRFLLKTPYVSLVNILLNKPVVPELLQENCTVKKIEKALLNELKNPSQEPELQKIRPLLMNSDGSLSASEQAAKEIIKIARSSFIRSSSKA